MTEKLPHDTDCRLAYFITPHGFGHAARAAAVMGALRQLNPAMQFDIFTLVPRWFFTESLNGGFTYHECMTDVGLVQQTTLDEDMSATVARLDTFLPFDDGMVRELASQVRARSCRLALCDIAPLGIAVARAAGIPSVLIENFTWDWIYEGYTDQTPALRPYADYLRDQFGAADYHIQAQPVCTPAPVDCTVPPIARAARTLPDETRRRLTVPPGASMVLITMGGGGWDYTFFDPLARHENAIFVVPGVDAEPTSFPQNVRLLASDSDLYHPDLAVASDLVIGKAGYSTLAEVYYAGVPFGYVLRDQFRESHVMAAFIEAHMHGQPITPTEFADGSWLCRLSQLLALPRVRRERPNGSTMVATFIRRLLDAE